VTFEIIQGKSRRRNPPSVPYSCSRVQKSFLFLVYYTRLLPPPPLLLLLRLRSKTIQQHQPLGYYTITTTAHYHPTREREREAKKKKKHFTSWWSLHGDGGWRHAERDSIRVCCTMPPPLHVQHVMGSQRRDGLPLLSLSMRSSSPAQPTPNFSISSKTQREKGTGTGCCRVVWGKQGETLFQLVRGPAETPAKIRGYLCWWWLLLRWTGIPLVLWMHNKPRE
jgi:hypothetical protein